MAQFSVSKMKFSTSYMQAYMQDMQNMQEMQDMQQEEWVDLVSPRTGSSPVLLLIYLPYLMHILR